MSAVGVLALAGAVTCWPTSPARLRVAWAVGSHSGEGRWSRLPHAWRWARSIRPGPLPVLATVGVLGAGLAGPGGAIAAVVLGLVVVRAHGAARRTRDRATATQGLAEGLGSFAAELRTGSPPAAAARAAARDGSGIGVRALTLVEATSRLGGDVPGALRAAVNGRGTGEPGASDLRRFADAWALAERHGIGLAGLAAAVAVDLRARARFAGNVQAQVAGPRATAMVLAGLPVLGVVLGEGIGAHPWAVLSGTTVGQVLLVVGVVLLGAGIEWTERIVAGVTR